jgi:hypothetical protein
VGVDVIALVTEWEPLVDAARQSGGFDFYWTAARAVSDALGDRDWSEREPALPYATEYDSADMLLSGRYLFCAYAYYDYLTEHLPEDLVQVTDAFFNMVIADHGEYPDDLATEAGLQGGTPHRMYTMRPATVRTALARADQVPWDKLEQYGDQLDPFEYTPYTYDYESFHNLVEVHLGLLKEAAEAGRGLVVIASW